MAKFAVNKTLNQIPYFEAGLWVLMLALGLWGTLNHVMWRDELNGWLIARDSLTWGDFWQSIRYEGHPILWYLILLGLNHFTIDPIAMQLAHLAIALTAIAIFLRFGVFTRLQKLLFVLGYLPLYEYHH